MFQGSIFRRGRRIDIFATVVANSIRFQPCGLKREKGVAKYNNIAYNNINAEISGKVVLLFSLQRMAVTGCKPPEKYQNEIAPEGAANA